jgi:hypothetical protein
MMIVGHCDCLAAFCGWKSLGTDGAIQRLSIPLSIPFSDRNVDLSSLAQKVRNLVKRCKFEVPGRSQQRSAV